MKDRMHHQMASDIKQGLRIDTVIFILAVVFNLFFMGVNSAVSSAVRGYEYTLMGGIGQSSIDPITLTILIILMLLVIITNFFVIRILMRGRERRAKLMAGLMEMYREDGADKFYDASLEQNSAARYNLYSVILVATASAATLIPILVAALGG